MSKRGLAERVRKLEEKVRELEAEKFVPICPIYPRPSPWYPPNPMPWYPLPPEHYYVTWTSDRVSTQTNGETNE